MSSSSIPISSTIKIGGISVSVNATKSTDCKLTGNVTRKEARHKLSAYDLENLRKLACAPGIVEIPLGNDDPSSIEDIYDFMHIIGITQRHLSEYDLLSCFNIVTPKVDPTTGDLTGAVTGSSRNLFDDHSQITYQSIEKSIQFFTEYVYSSAADETKWVESDLSWSGKFLFNQMDNELKYKIIDDIKNKVFAKVVPDEYKETGPVVLKALIDRMLNTNANTINLYKTYLTRDNISLEDFDGDIEEFAKQYITVIEALRKCEIPQTVNGIQRVVEIIPSNLSETLVRVFLDTGNELFDSNMKTIWASCKAAQAKGSPNAFPPPEDVLRDARDLYVSYKSSDDLESSKSKSKSPAGFNASRNSSGNKPKSKCFGCGREGCRQSEKSCPRHGKDPLPAGKEAKKAFDDAKKANKEAQANKEKNSNKKKWPAKPKKGEPNRQKIDGVWHYYHFRSKKWLECSEAAKKEADQSANIAKTSDSEKPGGLPAALAALTKGKDQSQVDLSKNLYLQRLNEAEEQFRKSLL